MEKIRKNRRCFKVCIIFLTEETSWCAQKNHEIAQRGVQKKAINRTDEKAKKTLKQVTFKTIF